MYRLIRESNMPRWLQILLNVFLTITIVYWLGYFIYKILDVVRLFLHTMSEKSVYWIALGIIFICAIVTMLILEYNTDIKPLTYIWEWIVNLYDNSKNKIIEFIQ